MNKYRIVNEHDIEIAAEFTIKQVQAFILLCEKGRRYYVAGPDFTGYVTVK